MKHVIVTGGAGFIGRHLVDLLISLNYKVTVLDKLAYAANPSLLNPKAKLIVDDINNYGLVKDLLFSEPTHYILNLAAESSVDKATQGSSEFIKTNINGVHVLLEAIKTASPQTRFVQVSTDEVLGHLTKDESAFNDNSPINPRNYYSATKAAAEHIVMSYVNTHGVNAVITRCTNNFGPGQHEEKLLPRVMASIKNKTVIPVYGKGDQVRDWIYVLDHCKGIVAAMEKGVSGQVYMFGGDNELQNVDVIKKIIDIAADLKLGSLEELSSLIEYVADRPGHDFRYAVDSSKAKKELQWTNSKDQFEILLKLTCESML